MQKTSNYSIHSDYEKQKPTICED